MRDTLRYLAKLVDAPIPPEVIDRLANVPTTWAQRYEYRAWTRAPESFGPVLTLWLRYRWYVRWVAEKPLPARLLGFPRYLKEVWKVDHLWYVPFYAVAKIFGQFAEKARWRRGHPGPDLPPRISRDSDVASKPPVASGVGRITG
jgi:hypothetical protein